MKNSLPGTRFVFSLYALLCSVLLCSQLQAQSKLEKIRVTGAALVGNLAGDDATRDVFVYLPASYAEAKDKRYPVIYFLHGYSATAQLYVEKVLQLPTAADQVMATNKQEAILVVPDAFTIYGGSMFSNSPTTGDWEGFIAHDLVSYIDSHYRTLAKRDSRGLSGHSMGGYGTVRIGMQHPEVFGALYAMSSCCLLNQAPTKDAVDAQITRMAAGSIANATGFANVLQAQAAAWAPNPQNPPYYFDWPFVSGDTKGEAQPLVQAKWTANSPLINIDQHVSALKQYRAIALDVGDKDTLAPTNKQLDTAMTRLGIKHSYEVYDGDHTNHIDQRFVEKLLPFFAQQLQAK